MNTTILTEDVIRHHGFKPNPHYDPVHLLQMAHSANLQMSIEIKARKREWNAFLQDGKAGRDAKFEVRTPWSDPADCMDILVATIYYHPNSPSPDDSVFFITERIMAITLAGSYTVESPLKSFKSEQQLIDYLEDEETAFKRYQHLEHIMERLRESEPSYRSDSYMAESLGEGMRVMKESINGWWKPRFLIDDNELKAYEFMDGMLILQTITDEDILWSTLKDLPAEAVGRAKAHSGLYPTFIRNYHNGRAEVTWQINPDGRYYTDDDGFGMTDDEEITLVGTIDRAGRVIIKFCYKG